MQLQNGKICNAPITCVFGNFGSTLVAKTGKTGKYSDGIEEGEWRL